MDVTLQQILFTLYQLSSELDVLRPENERLRARVAELETPDGPATEPD